MAPTQVDSTPSKTFDLPAALLTAWPAAQWRGVHVLAAVSGGSDSVGLLTAMLEASARHPGPGRVVAAHVNHQLRPDADADEQWLHDECDRLKAPLIIRRLDPAEMPRPAGDGLEAAARSYRYRLLTEMAGEVGARFVATAHTRDDQAETVLFRLIRGAGLRGLAGIRPRRPLTPDVSLVRPLLGVTRGEIESFLRARGQSWREDATNRDVRHARNRIRRRLLPYIQRHFNRDVTAALSQSASLAAEANELAEALATSVLERCRLTTLPSPESSQPTHTIDLCVTPLNDQHELVVREVLRLVWRAAGWAEQGMTFSWWHKLAQLALATQPAALNLPGNIIARRDADRLLLRRPAPPSPDAPT